VQRDSHSPVGFRESHHPSPTSSPNKADDTPLPAATKDDGSGSDSDDSESDRESSPPIFLNKHEEDKMEVDDEVELPPIAHNAAQNRARPGDVSMSERDLDAQLQSQIRRDTSNEPRHPGSTQSVHGSIRPSQSQMNGASSPAKGTAADLRRPAGRKYPSLQMLNATKPKFEARNTIPIPLKSATKPGAVDEDEESSESESESESDSSESESEPDVRHLKAKYDPLPASQPLKKTAPTKPKQDSDVSSSDSESDSGSDSDDNFAPSATQPVIGSKRETIAQRLLSDPPARDAGSDFERGRKKKRSTINFAELSKQFSM
jgi:hypothetical protein